MVDVTTTNRQHEYLQQQGLTEDQSAANRYSAPAIGATAFYRRQNVSSTIKTNSASVRADGTQNILPSQIPVRWWQYLYRLHEINKLGQYFTYQNLNSTQIGLHSE